MMCENLENSMVWRRNPLSPTFALTPAEMQPGRAFVIKRAEYTYPDGPTKPKLHHFAMSGRGVVQEGWDGQYDLDSSVKIALYTQDPEDFSIVISVCTVTLASLGVMPAGNTWRRGLYVVPVGKEGY